MPPIDPAELSAYLDGELPPERAEEIRAALARDPALRDIYDLLVVRDAVWKDQAASARFQPRVRFGRAPIQGGIWTAVVVLLGLLLLRLMLKALPPLFETGVEAILLVFVVGVGLGRILRATDSDSGRPVLAANG